MTAFYLKKLEHSQSMEIRRLALKKLDDYVVDESTILLIASWFLEHNGQIVINS